VAVDAYDEVALPPVDAQKTSEWIVVLSASGIHYRLSFEVGQWVIHIPFVEHELAHEELAAYTEESRSWQSPNEDVPPLWTEAESSGSSVWVGAMLIVFYVWTGPYSRDSALTCGAAMNTDSFFSYEWWRAVTALMVHAGPGHLAGNVVCMVLYGYALCRTFGGGLAWLLILATGVIGNTVAAWLHGPEHISVGASTACFGALGLLAASQTLQNLRAPRPVVGFWRRAWLPLGAGVAMLTLLGTGERSDLLAHLFGFLSGLALCIPFWWRRPVLHAFGFERALQMLSLAIVMFAWRLVLVTLGP
jgi:rhomboid protease GluP